jgi:hypothetical protein
MTADVLGEDDVLAQLAREQLAADPSSQLLCELWTRLRGANRPWWSSEALRVVWPAATRLGWFADRSDVRGRITHQITGLQPRAARLQPVEVQAALIDAVLDAGDVPPTALDDVLDPAEVAVHAPPGEIWDRFVERFPWGSPQPEDRALLLAIVESLLIERELSSGARVQILTPLFLRSAIDSRAWQTHVPLEARAAVDAARLRAEWETRLFDARQELAIVGLARLVECLPAHEIRPVVDAARRAMQAASGDAQRVVPIERAHRRSTDRVQRRVTG